MRLVFDAGVVFSGAGWRGDAYLCLVAMARRRVTAFGTSETLAEVQRLIAERGWKAQHSPHTVLQWYYAAIKKVSPVPLGKQRSRDQNDDPYLACALAASAKAIVSRDQDLQSLGRPFGIEILTPRQLLNRLADQR